MASTNFALGRSEFTTINPGTVVPMEPDGSFGRIKSVQMDNMCLDLGEQPFPIDTECKPIKVNTRYIRLRKFSNFFRIFCNFMKYFKAFVF